MRQVWPVATLSHIQPNDSAAVTNLQQGAATARSRLKFGSPRRGAPTTFSIRGHLLPFAGLSETAEDCPYHNTPLRASAAP
jgi:hypothetical protein